MASSSEYNNTHVKQEESMEVDRDTFAFDTDFKIDKEEHPVDVKPSLESLNATIEVNESTYCPDKPGDTDYEDADQLLHDRRFYMDVTKCPVSVRSPSVPPKSFELPIELEEETFHHHADQFNLENDIKIEFEEHPVDVKPNLLMTPSTSRALASSQRTSSRVPMYDGFSPTASSSIAVPEHTSHNFRCDKCKAEFRNRGILRAHIVDCYRQSSSGKVLSCKMCNRKFIGSTPLQTKGKHDCCKELCCEICKWISLSSFRQHVKYDCRKVHVCQKCGKKFTKLDERTRQPNHECGRVPKMQ